MYSPEIQGNIAVWRQKAIEGTLTDEELRQAILIMREGRIGASIASDASKTKKAKAIIPSAADLLSELEGL